MRALARGHGVVAEGAAAAAVAAVRERRRRPPRGRAAGGRRHRPQHRPRRRSRAMLADLNPVRPAPAYGFAGPPRSGRGGSTRRGTDARPAGEAGRAQGARPVPPDADDQRAPGPARRPRREAGAPAVLEQLPRARRPPARARGRGRRGDALGRRRRRQPPRQRHDDAAPPARGAPRRVQGHRGGAALRLGVHGQPRRHPGARARRARSCSPTSSTTPRSSTAAASPAPRPSSTTTATWTTSSGACARPTAAAPWSSPTACSRWTATSPRWRTSSSSRGAHGVRVMVDEAQRLGALGPGRPRRGRRGGARAGGRRGRRHARQGARLLRRVRRAASSVTARYLVNTRPHVHLLHGAAADRRRPPRWPRSSCSSSSRAASRSSQANADALRDELAREGFEVAGSTHADHPADRRRGARRRAGRRGGARAGRLRPGDPSADRARGHLAPAPRRDGVAHALRAARGGAGRWPVRRSGRACGRAPPSRWPGPGRAPPPHGPSSRSSCSTATPSRGAA